MSAYLPTIADFKDFAAGFQSMVVGVAIIIGGLWTVYTYWSLGTQIKARRDLFEQPVVNVKIDARQIWVPGDPNLYIAVTAVLTNTGNKNVALDFDASKKNERDARPFKVSRIGFDFLGQGATAECWGRNVSNSYDSSLSLIRGAVQELPLFSQVPSPGLYLVEFAADLDLDTRLSDPTMSTLSADTDLVWTSSAYVVVTEQRAAQPATATSDSSGNRTSIAPPAQSA